jgi:hypothetical protein
MGSLARINALAYEAALNLAASSPRADYTPGQLPALPLPLQTTDILIIWRSASGQTYQVPASSLTALIGGSTAPQEKPAGRLTLTSGQPVMNADVNNAGIILFTPYVGNLCPIYNGTTWVMTPFVETALTLNAGFNTTGNVYDVFGYITAGGVFALVAGPAWTVPASSRGVGAGTTQIQQVNGLWVNAVSLTGNNGAAQTVIAAQNGTYLGSFFANGNAQCTMNFKPAAAVGGSANILGLYNAYNRVTVKSVERDATTTTAYAVNTWRSLNNSNSNRITFVDGLQQSYFDYDMSLTAGITVNGGSPVIAANVDSTVATPIRQAEAAVTTITSTGEVDLLISVSDSFTPLLGLHFLQAMQFSGGSISVNYLTSGGGGQSFYGMRLILEM